MEEDVCTQNRSTLLGILQNKSALKQDIYLDTKKTFNELREVVRKETEYLKSEITDPRIRMNYESKGDYEFQAFVGSDLLVFHMHTNVFMLPKAHPFWNSDYLKANPQFGYFGTIYIYNFLAQSYLQGRSNDLGYLIGRIFINGDGHFFIEGKGELGTTYKDLSQGVLTTDLLQQITHVSFAHALDFDLLVPPYELVSQINIMQVQAISSSLNMQTGKRLGFKFEAEHDEIF